MNLTPPGDKVVATINPQLDVVLDSSNRIVLATPGDRLVVDDVKGLAQALLSAAMLQRQRVEAAPYN